MYGLSAVNTLSSLINLSNNMPCYQVVEIIVADSEAEKFQKLDKQPVKSIYRNNIFWTYKKQEGDASMGRFKHTLIEKVLEFQCTLVSSNFSFILY